MTDILDLPDWTLIAKHREDEDYILEAEYTKLPDFCPNCGVVGELYKHGTKLTTYRDAPIRGRPAVLRAVVRRFRCRSCGKTFLQPLKGVLEERFMTERCQGYIQEQCLRDTFVRIAEHVGCDEKTVRTVAAGYVEGLHAKYRPWLPELMGVDETKIGDGMRLVITDIGERRPVDMLTDRNKDVFRDWLLQFPSRHRVKAVAIDMWRPYKDVVNELLPGVPVVIDKFHVVRMANEGMERIRIRTAKSKAPAVRKDWKRSKALLNMRHAKINDAGLLKLDIWLANEPDIQAAHALKESFYGIYSLPKAQAAKAYDAWPGTIPKHLKPDFRKLTTAMKNWRTEILAYFDWQLTNAYTEALNGVTKQINRAGRGYSFEVLRARVLYRDQRPAPDTRCESCQGVFDPVVLSYHAVPAVTQGEHSKRMQVCANCHRRFHMSFTAPDHDGSTH